MKEYVPIEFSTLIIEPKNGIEDSLCPIIFLHGFMESKEVWQSIAQSVCDKTGRKAYVYDARNHGDSEWTEEFTMDLLVEDLDFFMKTNHIAKAVLIGFSMGGYAASKLALKFPEKVELVIIEDIILGKYPKYLIKASVKLFLMWADAVNKAPTNTSKRDAIKFAVDYMYNQIPLHKQKTLSDKEKLYECNYAFKLEDSRYEIKVNIPPIVRSIENWENIASPAEGIFDGPASFINGESSIFKAFRTSNDEILKHFPNAELETVEGATHTVHIDQPEKYMDTIMCFLIKNKPTKL